MEVRPYCRRTRYDYPQFTVRGRSIASLHAEVPSDSDFVAVHEENRRGPKKRVWQQTGVYLVIHMDPIDIINAYVNALREQTDGVLRQIDGQLTMHDFRIVDGKTPDST